MADIGEINMKIKMDKDDHNSKQSSAYHAKLEKWTSKELQLNILHEEVLNKREAMLRTSRNFLFGGKKESPLIDNTDAAIRNNKLLKDINGLEEKMEDSLMQNQSPRFTTLQVNYWSMVKNMIPIWQKSMQEAEKPTAKNTASYMYNLERV